MCAVSLPMQPDSPEVLEGVIDRVTYRNSETGYSVLRLRVPGRKALVTAVGSLGPVSVGEGMVLTGFWINHPEYGPQFQFSSYQPRRPSTGEAVERYLGSGAIPGIGPAIAKRLVARFGAEALMIIEHQPQRLREVPGIGEKKIQSIREAVEQHRAVQEIAIFLQGCQVSPAFAERLYSKYGEKAMGVIAADPYALTTEIRGIGFRTADQIAMSMGIEKDAGPRLAAGLVYVLSQAADEGHTYLPLPHVYARAARILDVAEEKLNPVMPALLQSERLIGEPADEGQSDRIFLPPLYRAEVGLAGRLCRLLGATGRKPLPTARVLEWLERRRGPNEVALSPEQNQALALAMEGRVTIITGGPGTGKSTIMRALVRAFETAGRTVLLASPTGRAARRLSDLTDRPAATLHRLLEFDSQKGAFRRDSQHPLKADLIVVDEVSMLDVLLANSLIKAVPPGSHLVLIGDIDQLPSVGPGNVLRDLIDSDVLPVCRLTHVFRQALGSLTVRNAHRVNAGELPELIHPSRRGEQDCVFLEAEEPEKAIQRVCQLLSVSFPRQGFTPDMVQVLAPMNKGPLGVLALNGAVQEVLNPAADNKAQVSRAGATFRVGDRVIQLVNDYDKDVFNGDVGQIIAIDTESSMLHVAFPTSAGDLAASGSRTEYMAGGKGQKNYAAPGARLAAETLQTYRPHIRAEESRPGPQGKLTSVEGTRLGSALSETGSYRRVEYRFIDLDELQLAYAMTVHKAQGSEFPAILFLVHDVHAPMLRRNLLYTGLTRGRKLTVLLGSRRAIGQAVRRQSDRARLTGLSPRLQRFHETIRCEN